MVTCLISKMICLNHVLIIVIIGLNFRYILSETVGFLKQYGYIKFTSKIVIYPGRFIGMIVTENHHCIDSKNISKMSFIQERQNLPLSSCSSGCILIHFVGILILI